MATRRRDLLRSLTLIEPPAFGLAADQPDVAAVRERLIPVFAPDSGLSPEQFSVAFARRAGPRAPGGRRVLAGPARAKRADIMREPGPWTAPIEPGRDRGGAPAHARGLRRLASGVRGRVRRESRAALGAQRLVLPGAGHSPQRLDEGRPLNAALAALWAAGRLIALFKTQNSKLKLAPARASWCAA